VRSTLYKTGWSNAFGPLRLKIEHAIKALIAMIHVIYSDPFPVNYKFIAPDHVTGTYLNELKSSLIVIDCNMENLVISPKDIETFEATDNIIKLESPYGTKYSSIFQRELSKPSKSARAQPTDKYIIVEIDGVQHMELVPSTKNKKHMGQMDSQIQFHMATDVINANDKTYKIKFFSKGCFQIPGVLEKDYSDVWPTLVELEAYFRRRSPDVKLSIKIRSIMHNCMSSLRDASLLFQLRKVPIYFKMWNAHEEQDIAQHKNSPNPEIRAIFRYIKLNHWDITSIGYDPNKNNTNISFYRISSDFKIKKKKLKILTCKLLKCKANFNGSKELAQAIEIYNLLEVFIAEYSRYFIYKKVPHAILPVPYLPEVHGLQCSDAPVYGT
jgi:hypothetical protein